MDITIQLRELSNIIVAIWGIAVAGSGPRPAQNAGERARATQGPVLRWP